MASSRPVSHIRDGIIIAAILIAIQVTLNLTGQYANETLQSIAYLPLVAGIIYFVIGYAKRNPETTFGNRFGYGFKVLSIVIVFIILYVTLFYTIFPQYKDKMIDGARRAYEAAQGGRINDEEIDNNMAALDKHFIQLLVTRVLFTHLMIGTLMSLVAAFITSKRLPLQNTKPSKN